MPTYEYKCQGCGYLFEEFQSITADPISKCPKCKARVKRLVGGGLGVIFKGSGFYTTDYKNSSANTGNGKAASGPAESKKDGKESKDSVTTEKKTDKSAEKTPAAAD